MSSRGGCPLITVLKPSAAAHPKTWDQADGAQRPDSCLNQSLGSKRTWWGGFAALGVATHLSHHIYNRFPGGTGGKCRRRKRCGFRPWVRTSPGGGHGKPTPVLLPGEPHGQRSLAGYSPWGRKESDTAEAYAYMLMSKKREKRKWSSTALGNSTISPTASKCWEACDMDLHKRHFASGTSLHTVESTPLLQDSPALCPWLWWQLTPGENATAQQEPRASCWSFSLMSTSWLRKWLPIFFPLHIHFYFFSFNSFWNWQGKHRPFLQMRELRKAAHPRSCWCREHRKPELPSRGMLKALTLPPLGWELHKGTTAAFYFQRVSSNTNLLTWGCACILTNTHTSRTYTRVCVWGPTPRLEVGTDQSGLAGKLRADPKQGGSWGWWPRQSQHPQHRVAGVDPTASPNQQGRTIRQVLSSSQAQKLERGPMISSLNI